MTAARASALLLLPLLCGLSFFRAADRPGLLEKDEPRYAVPAREMVRSGDLLVPRFAGQERLEKPPGAYWAQAAAFAATGRFDERSARLPSAIAASLTVLLVAVGCGRALGWGAALAAGAALATMLHFVAAARLATTDMLHALLFLASAAAWLPVLEGSPRPGRWILLAGALAGAAALAKTPLALFLPPLAAAGTAFVLGRIGGPEWIPPAFRPGARRRTALFWAGGAAIAAAIFLAWYLPCDGATDGRLRRVLTDEVRSRADAGKSLHEGPAWYFLAVAAGGALPWTPLLPAGVFAAMRNAHGNGPKRPLGLFAGLLGLAVLLFFSALPSKLPNYVLPLVPCAAVLAGLAVPVWAEHGLPGFARSAAGWGTIAVGAVLLAAPWLVVLREAVGPEAAAALRPALLAQGAILVGAGAAALAGRAVLFAAAAAASTTALLLLAGPAVPHLDGLRCARPMGEAMLAAGLEPGDRIVDASNQVTGLPWYLDAPVETRPGGRSFRVRDVPAVLSAGGRAWAVLKHDPREAEREGRRTAWDEVRAGLPPGARVRVVWEGWERVVVTTAP